ncbi:MAG: tRNA pseudouridine(54/55) synthase Pus10, partial [Methanomicrobiales archaeon]|nr:tRNA pseudouridine(54/55) synthase Pus10 [Methanomicrobiales archaeon]
MEITEQVTKVLAYGEICDHCLGRFFGKRSHGLANDERGRGLRIAQALGTNTPYKSFAGTCWVCGNFFTSVSIWADRVVEAVKDIEFSTLLVGCRVPPLIAENEEMVWSDLSLADPEPFKSEVNREVGKAVSAKIGKVVDFKKPDVVIILDLANEKV